MNHPNCDGPNRLNKPNQNLEHCVQRIGINNFIIDPHSPPIGRFRLETLYVIVSHATTLDNFAILCDFVDFVFGRSTINREQERYNVYLHMENLVTWQKLQDEREYIAGLC